MSFSSNRFGDHKRDRFDSYGRMSGGYHRDRDRERDRGMHMNDKRKYVYNNAHTNVPPHKTRLVSREDSFSDYYRYASGPPGYGYGPGGYGGGSGGYPAADIASSHFRGRGGYPSDSYPGDWRPNKDYRRDYDRRPPPPNSNS